MNTCVLLQGMVRERQPEVTPAWHFNQVIISLSSIVMQNLLGQRASRVGK